MQSTTTPQYGQALIDVQGLKHALTSAGSLKFPVGIVCRPEFKSQLSAVCLSLSPEMPEACDPIGRRLDMMTFAGLPLYEAVTQLENYRVFYDRAELAAYLEKDKVEDKRVRELEDTLRSLWNEEGVPKERQDEILADIAAKAKPGAFVGPFRIPERLP